MTDPLRTIVIAASILLPAVASAQTCAEYATNPPTMEGCSSSITDVPGIWGKPERQSATTPGAHIVPPHEDLGGTTLFCRAGDTACTAIGIIAGPAIVPPLSPDAKAMAGRVGKAVALELVNAKDQQTREMLKRVLDAVTPEQKP